MAQAQNGYRIYNGGVNERSGPGTNYQWLGWKEQGEPIDIACQSYGTWVSVRSNSSNIWNRQPNGRWVSDMFVDGTPYRQFDARLPRCDGTREDHAIAWVRSQVGSTGWNGWCDRFVANAFGRERSGYATAAAHYRALRDRGYMHDGDTNVPAGALAFSAGNSSAGHVMLSLGGGRFITTADRVKEVDLSYGGQYWGWSWADPEWAGR